MKRIEFSKLPKLHAICNRWMHFFCSLLVFILNFGAPAKKMSTAPSAHYFGSFFSCEKSQIFVAIWNDFPNLAQFFERPTLVDQSSANSSRLLTKLSGMLRFGVRFSRRTFWPVLECSRFGEPICRPKSARCRIGIPSVGNQKTWKKAMFRRMAHASHRPLCKEKRP